MRTRSRGWVIVGLLSGLVLPGLSGCATASSALSPLATAAPLAPARGAAQVRVRESTLTGVERADDPARASLWAPRAQLEGALALRILRWLSVRVLGGSALDVDALAVSSATHSPPDRAAWFFGAAPTFQLREDHGRTVLDVGPEIYLALIPARYSDRCPPESPCSFDRIDFVPMFGANATVSRYVHTHVRLFGGLTVRSHPSLDGAFSSASDSYTDIGHVTFVTSAGLEVSITEAIGLSAEAQWIAPVAPFFYLPVVGVSVFGTIGDHALQARDDHEDPMRPATWGRAADPPAEPDRPPVELLEVRPSLTR